MPSKIIDKSHYVGLRLFLLSHGWSTLLIIVSSLLIYAQSITYDYVLDDKIVYTQNTYVQKGISGWSDILRHETFQGYFVDQKNLVQGSRYRPLSLLTFAAEYQFFGVNSSVSHMINVIFYALLCVLIYWFLFLLFDRDFKMVWYKQISFWAALLFCVHPLHTEVVANVKGRDEILVLVFMVLSIIGALKYTDLNNRKYLIASMIYSFLALMAKENAIMLPILIPMTLYVFRRADLKLTLIIGAIVAVPAFIYIVIRYSVIGYLIGDEVITDIMNNPFYGMSAGDKYATVVYTLGNYIKLLIWPHPLTHDYYPYHIPVMSWSSIWVWSALLGHIVLLGYGLRYIYKRSIPAYFILFYLITLFIVSNLLISVGTFMNERFVFVPSIAFCALMAYSLFVCAKRMRSDVVNKIRFPVLIMTCVAFATISFIRVPVWQNSSTLNQAAIKVSTQSARANLFMGTELYNQYASAQDSKQKMNYLDQASAYITRATEILPTYGAAQKMRAGIYAERYARDGDLNKLLNGFVEILEHHPGNRYIHDYLVYLEDQNIYSHKLERFYFDIGYNKLYRKLQSNNWARHFINQGLKINNDNAELNYAAGILLNLKTARSGESHLQKARKLNPDIDRIFGR